MGGFPLFSNKPKYVPELKLFVPWKSPKLPLSHWRMIPETKQTHQSITKQLKGDTTSSSQPALTKGTLRRPWLRRCEVNPGMWPSLDTVQTMSWSVKWWLFENQLWLDICLLFKVKVKYNPVLAEKGTTDSSVDPARLHFRSVMHAKQNEPHDPNQL